MPAWTVIPALVAAGFVPGWLIVRHFNRGRLSLPLVFAALALGLAALGWAALVLAEVGLFSVGRLAIVWALLTGGLLVLGVWRGRVGRSFVPAGPFPHPHRGGEGAGGPPPNPLPEGGGAGGPLPCPLPRGEGAGGPLPNPLPEGEGVSALSPSLSRRARGLGISPLHPLPPAPLRPNTAN